MIEKNRDGVLGEGKDPKTGEDCTVLPKARRQELVLQEVAGELLVYDISRHQAHSLNLTAAFIWKHCDGSTAVPELGRRVEEEFGLPFGEAVVRLALGQLRKARLLEGAPAPAQSPRYTRRGVARMLGLGTAVYLLPAIATVMVPGPAAAASGCLPDGNCRPGVDLCRRCGRTCTQFCDPVGNCGGKPPGC